MLTSELLVTRISKGKIEPIYALLNQENLAVASSVIDIFQNHVGRTYGELIGELEGLEEINYRLIRGLDQLLERRCLIGEDSGVDPISARRAVFEESRGFVTSEDEREEVLGRVARKLSIKADELEKALWADQEENLVVKDFKTIAPEDLLRQYNLSLAQTLLFRATAMEIQIEDNYQPVFRKVKQLGLMYSLHDGRISLEGPLSIFKLTEKYGSAFARLLPTIMESSRWSLKASISKKTFQGKRIYEFALDSTKSSIFGADAELEPAEIGFDSAIEREFYELGFGGWAVRREPTVLQAGQYAFIPDFSLERDGLKIYVEIVGFWTPEYLKQKIQKINQLQEKEKESIILLVNRNLACSGSEFQTDNLIFYDRKVPHLEIIKILRRYEKKQQAEEIAKLRGIEISFGCDASVINLDEIAERYGVSIEALREVIKGQNKPDYSLLGNQLVSNRVLETIQGELMGVEKHDAAIKIFEGYGIKAYSQALSLLGYRVKWSGLDPENAEIVKMCIEEGGLNS
jgi:predicted nuclease of restriction endonuclease-like RecB superfamily